jgi:hypothetical protein
VNREPHSWTTVRNIGPVSITLLRTIGVHTPAELFALGPVATYHLLWEQHPGKVTRTMLWALVDADLGLDWRELPAEVKKQVTEELNQRSMSSPS